MVIKHYAEVKPGAYVGTPEGVEMREMNTARDGAPEWEHEVFILRGNGRVKTEGHETPFRAGDSVYIAPHETHCFFADPGTPVRFVCVIPAKNRCQL